MVASKISRLLPVRERSIHCTHSQWPGSRPSDRIPSSNPADHPRIQTLDMSQSQDPDPRYVPIPGSRPSDRIPSSNPADESQDPDPRYVPIPGSRPSDRIPSSNPADESQDPDPQTAQDPRIQGPDLISSPFGCWYWWMFFRCSISYSGGRVESW